MTAVLGLVPATEPLDCTRCHTDAVADGWAHTDQGWYCPDCYVICSITDQPVPIDQAVQCAGSSVTYPEFHSPDAWTDCGACRDDAAREQQYEEARDAYHD